MKKYQKATIIFGLFFVFLILIFEAQLIFNFSLWILVSVAFLCGLFFSFLLIPHRVGLQGIEPKDWLYVFVFSFVVAEMIFLLSFWPFDGVTTSVVLLVVYYVMWDIWSLEKKNKLTINKVVFNVILIIASLAAVLFTVKWLP